MIKTLALAATLTMMPMSLALADCVDTAKSAETSNQPMTAPIEKDGSRAPLETQATGNTETPAHKESAQKDGSTMPLATEEGEGDNLATSQQDIEAQQHGEKTAAAKAKDDCSDKS